MSTPGRPKGEYRSAQHQGTPVSTERPAPEPAAPHGALSSEPAAALRLEQALQLLQHAGLALPPGTPADAHWLQHVVDGLVELSSRDPLTDLANRRAFEVALSREIDRVARSGEPALLLALDLDHFKAVNDLHGHPVGDAVLQAVAQVLADSVRPMDLVARLGGEEFAIVMPNCGAGYGLAVAERVRLRVQQLRVTNTRGETFGVTVSIGGAFAPQWVRSTPAMWMTRTDLQLYEAKAGGRNRVCMEHAAVPQISAEEKKMLFDASHFLEGDLG
jgi:diguanylate cyclase